MVLQSVKNIVENTQWKMHDFDSEYVFSTSSVKYVVENECSHTRTGFFNTFMVAGVVGHYRVVEF